MTLGPGTRFMAARTGRAVMHGVLGAATHRDAGHTLDALEALELISPSEAGQWRARLTRLRARSGIEPLLPEPVRERARAQIVALAADHDAGWRTFEARRALEQVGALSWRDASDELETPGLVVDRVLIAPPVARSELTVTAVVTFADALQVHWCGTLPFLRPDVEAARPFPARTVDLVVTDDLGGRYEANRSQQSGGQQRSFSGSQTFVPAPSPGARWLEIASEGSSIARIPLA